MFRCAPVGMLTPMTRLASIACLSFLAACGGTSPAALGDASADANADASTDAGTDASDASTDAATPRYAMPSCDAPAFVGSPLGTRCGHFVDAEGRVRFLLGVNARVEGLFDVSFDDGRLPSPPDRTCWRAAMARPSTSVQRRPRASARSSAEALARTGSRSAPPRPSTLPGAREQPQYTRQTAPECLDRKRASA